MVTSVDGCVGRVLDILRELALGSDVLARRRLRRRPRRRPHRPSGDWAGPLSGDQGLDLVAVGAGGAQPREVALSAYRDAGHAHDPEVPTTMLRTAEHEIVIWHRRPATDRDAEGESYDLAADPDEVVDLWDGPDAQTVKVRLPLQLADVLVSLEDRSAARTHPW